MSSAQVSLPPTALLTITTPALERLAALLLERVGLKITPDGYYGLKLALRARLPATRLFNADAYVELLSRDGGDEELRALLPLVTVGKTDFFRDAHQFAALEKIVVPEMLGRARAEGRKVRVWSAGCATGEEPYSVAMLAADAQARADVFDIWATDLNPAAIESAQRGIFPLRRMGGVTDGRVERYFDMTAQGYVVNDTLRALVRFEDHNLAAPVFVAVESKSFDLILCRNVIIYFDEPTIRSLLDRFYEALRPGGYLFLGYSETLFKMSARYQMVEMEGAFVYRRPPPGQSQSKLPAVAAPPVRTQSSARLPVVSLPLPSAPAPSRPRPTAPPPEPHIHSANAPKPAPQYQSDIARLLAAGQFSSARAQATEWTRAHPNDLAAVLTLGNVCVLENNHDEARRCFDWVQTLEPLCVEVYVYGAVAALQAGHVDDARKQLDRAVFLEPTLAVGHYLMGQACERQGDAGAARKAYRNALTQLKVPQRELVGHFPELPESGSAITQAAQFRLAALAER